MLGRTYRHWHTSWPHTELCQIWLATDRLYEARSYLTAGARAERGTEPKPAALTAVACKRPSRTLTPTGIASIACVPISRTKKKNQSVKLNKSLECQRRKIEVRWKGPDFRARTTVRRNHVWCDGNKYTKQRRGWSSRKWRVACVRDFLVTILDNIQLHRLSVCIASMIINERLTLWSVD